MKYLVLVCEGMAGEPLDELDGRTPLEVAKTPWMDKLARKGRIGNASFVPRSLEASADAACMAILGYDPEEFHTGLAPLETLANAIAQDDRQVAFRCDFVTVSDGVLVDAAAGRVSEHEAGILLKELTARFPKPKFLLHPVGGYRNLLIVNDPEMAEELDELECVPPVRFLGQKYAKFLPQGKGAATLIKEFVEASRQALENHEVNRVRIDLKENPANTAWLWGQGRKPKMPAFRQRFGLDGAVFSRADFANGVAAAAGFEILKKFPAADPPKDLTFVWHSAGAERAPVRDLKSKVRWIEEFDAEVVAALCKEVEGSQKIRVLITTDLAESPSRRVVEHGAVPYLIAGAGVAGASEAAFNEKNCLESRFAFAKGHELLGSFLKP